MNRTSGLLAVLILLATPCLAQDITIDYAHDFDFSTVKTFTYVETEDSDMSNELMDNRIEQAVIASMAKGLEQVEQGGDIYVTYHTVTEDNTVFNTSHYGYGGYGPGWGGYGGFGYGGGMGMGSSTTTAHTYTEGTLILDAYDATNKEMIWRGTGTVTVKAKPEKQMKQIDNILEKMDKKWDKILKNQGE